MKFSLFNRKAAPQGGAPGCAVEMERIVSAHNTWREQHNPLRGLSMPTIVGWLEQAQRGEFADIQWAYNMIERRDADLMAIIDRRVGATLQMDWDINVAEKRWKARGQAQAYDATLAAEQQSRLRAVYDAFDNLYAAIEHLGMATFRGYAHVQFLANGALLKDLNILDQWNVLRDGWSGDWFWNPGARVRNAAGLKDADRLELSNYIVRTSQRPVNEIAIIKFMRQNLSAKDWDSFLEIYGIPGWIVTMPPSIPQGKEADYQAAAERVAEGGSGALPNGSDAKCADSPRGIVPFEPHLRYWTEKLVLAGTGGLLTMLAMPQGIGSGAADEQGNAFDILVRADARRISEAFQKSLDRFILKRDFPGRPALAYFSIAANEEVEVDAILNHVVAIANAGGQVDWSQISEKTGYKIMPSPRPAAPVPGAPAGIWNRAEADPVESARGKIAQAAAAEDLAVRRDVLSTWFAQVEELSKQEMPEADFLSSLEMLVKEMPAELLSPENIGRLAEIREGALGAALFNAVADRMQKQEGAQ